MDLGTAQRGGADGDVQHCGVGEHALIETYRQTAENRAAGVDGDAFDTLRSIVRGEMPPNILSSFAVSIMADSAMSE